MVSTVVLSRCFFFFFFEKRKIVFEGKFLGWLNVAVKDFRQTTLERTDQRGLHGASYVRNSPVLLFRV